jgi:antitoxin component YwqK of YwqJK toxin-antitoxin module
MPFNITPKTVSRAWLHLLLLLLLCTLPNLAHAQTENFPPVGQDISPAAPSSLRKEFAAARPKEGEKPVIYEDTLSSDKRKKGEKKIPKKTFWGIRTRKAYTRVIAGRKKTYELFYILRKPLEPDPYIRDIYWYHKKKRKIFMGPIPIKDKSYAYLLHGPYEKLINKVKVETGLYYVGTKTGRWETFANSEEQILAEKKKWYKGWPREAKMSWYDPDRKKVKEVIPYENAELQGEYFRFYESGVIAENGRYEFGQKVGVWRQWFEQKKRTKLEMQHAPDGFVKNFEPYRIREFDVAGTLLYDKATEDKKLADKNKK